MKGERGGWGDKSPRFSDRDRQAPWPRASSERREPPHRYADFNGERPHQERSRHGDESRSFGGRDRDYRKWDAGEEPAYKSQSAAVHVIDIDAHRTPSPEPEISRPFPPPYADGCERGARV